MEAGKRKISIALETEPGKKFKNGQSCQNCEKLQKSIEQRDDDIRRLQSMLNDGTTLKTLESKIDKLSEVVTKQEAPKSSVANFSIDALHSKVDKLVRLLGDTVEAQAKMSKTIENLSKTFAAKPAKTTKPPPTSLAATLKMIQKDDNNANKKTNENEVSEAVVRQENIDLADIFERQKTESGIVELRWANNLMLIGDDLWKSFSTVDDVSVIIEKMTKTVNLKLNCRPNETISRLYDAKREKLLFAFPPKIYRIAISIGAADLLSDESLLTLRQASLEEVKQKNLAPLQEKAEQLRGMVTKLLALHKDVILVIPASGTQRVEVFRQWEEIVIETFQDVTLPSFKILNLPDLIRSTLLDFKNQEDHLTTWFSDLTVETRLSPYGTRRLFDALKRTVLSRTKNYLEGRYFSNDFPPCPRCTRQHSNKPSTCRSIDRMCRQCGLVGHFVEVHAVTDPKFRREIVAEIGFDIYSIQGCPPDPNVPNAASSSIGIVSTPSQVPASLGTFSDWYAV